MGLLFYVIELRKTTVASTSSYSVMYCQQHSIKKNKIDLIGSDELVYTLGQIIILLPSGPASLSAFQWPSLTVTEVLFYILSTIPFKGYLLIYSLIQS